MRSLIPLLFCNVIAALGCGNPASSATPALDAEYDRQMKANSSQLEVSAKQQEETQRQLDVTAKQSERFERLLIRWEQQADRQDRLLDLQERQIQQQNRAR